MKHATLGTDEPAALAAPPAYQAFDHLATMVAIVSPDGHCLFANATFEQVLGLSRRAVLRSVLFDWFAEPDKLRDTVAAVIGNEFSTSRLDALLKRGAPHGEALPVHVIVNQMDRPNLVLVEMIELQLLTRQDREERALGQAQANKELIRNRAHEIKNPLGGIRGAAQLLAMEVESRELTEYTQVIVHEADR
ncbi:MAG TPA: histidine kinase dimerization/phospho-acceptor domain-containing protein, partial [Burkholderiaceae bacterium]|nr:histidine kinase dimerization/phospho-acceptor domain-containing protein [Burkholderiaceae bacterium]